jgi:hypothetical protein
MLLLLYRQLQPRELCSHPQIENPPARQAAYNADLCGLFEVVLGVRSVRQCTVLTEEINVTRSRNIATLESPLESLLEYNRTDRRSFNRQRKCVVLGGPY